MQFTTTECGEVTKGICEQGSETCVKSVTEISDEKSTVFISSSVGCPMQCKFCHLTIKDVRYAPLSQEDIELNTLATMHIASYWNDDIEDRALKLSWMGMGDAMLNPKVIIKASNTIMDELEADEMVTGLQRIDVSTVMPRSVGTKEMDEIGRLHRVMQRDGFRMFYSLFSAIPETRGYMIPNCKSADTAMNLFRGRNMKVTIHQIFIAGVNDSLDEVIALCHFINKNSDIIEELRVLEYNEAPNSWWFESDHMESIREELEGLCIVPVKYQVSPGKEIKAACGMFE